MGLVPVFIGCPATSRAANVVLHRSRLAGRCRSQVHMEVRVQTVLMPDDVNVFKPAPALPSFVQRLDRRTESSQYQVLREKYGGRIPEYALHLHLALWDRGHCTRQGMAAKRHFTKKRNVLADWCEARLANGGVANETIQYEPAVSSKRRRSHSFLRMRHLQQ